MSYAVKELFYTLQGEGVQTGRPAVFLRFAKVHALDGAGVDHGRLTAFIDILRLVDMPKGYI